MCSEAKESHGYHGGVMQRGQSVGRALQKNICTLCMYSLSTGPPLLTPHFHYVYKRTLHLPVSVLQHDVSVLVSVKLVQLLHCVGPHGDKVTQLALLGRIEAGAVLHPWPVAHESKPCVCGVWHPYLLV